LESAGRPRVFQKSPGLAGTKGNFHEHSDIDIAIVVDRVAEDDFSIHPLLFKLRRQIDNRIETVLIEREHDDAGFLDEIIKTGIEIK